MTHKQYDPEDLGMNVTARKVAKPATRPAAKLNRRKYVELLAKAVPTVITSAEEYDRIVAIVDRLAVKPDLSVEEDRLLELLSTLVEVYENEHCPIPDTLPHIKSTPTSASTASGFEC